MQFDEKLTIIGRLNYPHFSRNGITTFHFQRFAHNRVIIENVKKSLRSDVQDMKYRVVKVART